MDTPKIIYDGKTTPDDMRALLDLYQLEFVSLRDIDTVKANGSIVFDVSLRSTKDDLKLKCWLSARSSGTIVIFVADSTSHHEGSQALSLRATALLHRWAGRTKPFANQFRSDAPGGSNHYTAIQLHLPTELTGPSRSAGGPHSKQAFAPPPARPALVGGTARAPTYLLRERIIRLSWKLQKHTWKGSATRSGS